MTVDPDDPVLLLDKERMEVDPGGEVRLEVSVRNPTTIVEEYVIDVVGPAAGWSAVEPARLNVMPGANAAATVVLSPPRVPPPAAGDTDFAVRCQSQLDRSHAAVVEAELIVGAFKELLLQIAPTTSKGVGKGKHRVVLINRGNLTDRVRLSATDPNDELRFKFAPDIIDVPGPGQVEAKLVAKAPATFLKGQPKQHRFEVVYGPVLPKPGEESDVRPTPATFVQRPWLSPGVVALLALLAVVAVLAGVLLTLRGDPASRATERTLVAPEFRTSEPSAIDSVRLAWNPIDDAQRYLVERLPAGSTEAAPVAEEVKEVAGQQDTFVWPGLAPNTEYCFRVVAETSTGRSDPSPTTCLKTLEQAPFPPPSGLSATPVPDTNLVTLTWTPSGPQATHVILVDGVPQPETAVGDTAQVTIPSPEPGRLYCFTVAGVAAEGSQTAPSNQFCVPVGPPPSETTVAPDSTQPTVAPTVAPTVTPPGTIPPTGGTTPPTVVTVPTVTTATTVPGGTTTPPATTIFVNPGFMVILETVLAGDFTESDPLTRAQARQQEYVDAGFEVNVATTEALALPGEPAWVLYVDGMESQDAAAALCSDLRSRGLITPGQNCIIQDRR